MIEFMFINPVAFEVGPLQVHWYGLAYFSGLLGAILLGRFRARISDTVITVPMVTDIVVYAAFGAILGGRLGYVLFYNLSYFATNPIDIFKIWEGGMSFHGGLFGVVVGLWLYARRHDFSFFQLSDFVAPLCAVGLFFGRIANFINQELWGRPTSAPWGIVFPNDANQIARHPSQLYEAFLEGLLLFSILWIYSSKPRTTGSISGLFLLCYGLFRFLVEFVREPDHGIGFIMANWVTMGQLLSLPLIILGTYILIWSRKNNPQNSVGA